MADKREEGQVGIKREHVTTVRVCDRGNWYCSVV